MKKKISFIFISIIIMLIILQNIVFAEMPEILPNVFNNAETTITNEGTDRECIKTMSGAGTVYMYYPASKDLFASYLLDDTNIGVKYYCYQGNKWQLISQDGYINFTTSYGVYTSGQWKSNLPAAIGTLGDEIVAQCHFITSMVSVNFTPSDPTVTKIDGNEYEKVEPVNIDEVISNANGFVDKGTSQISDENMQTISNVIYSTLLIIGIIATFLIGAILGIKFITSGIEEKAETKQMFVPYIIGVVVLFGAFTIWKIVLNVLQG